MNKILLVIFLVIFPVLSSAQDVIIKTNGRRILCKIIKIDESHIYYDENQDLFRNSIRRNEVFEIQYGESSLNTSQPGGNKNKTQISNLEFKNSATMGFLEGGGALFGLDYERMIYKSLALQIGAGFAGYGAGMNIHLKPTNRSSYFSLQYIHQGYKETFSQSAFGPCFVFRARKVISLQIGFAFTLEKGPAWPEKMTQPPVMLTYAVGIYTPF